MNERLKALMRYRTKCLDKKKRTKLWSFGHYFTNNVVRSLRSRGIMSGVIFEL